MPIFKMQGQVYYLIVILLLEIGNNAKFLRKYFISESDQLSTRTSMIPNLIIANSFA
jgi:hypothetical protein